MSTPMIILLAVLAVDAAIVAWAMIASRRHASVMGRATERPVGDLPVRRIVLSGPEASRSERLRETVEGLLPEGLLAETNTGRLVRAGFDSPLAPAVYAFLRLLSAMAFPALALLVTPRDSMMVFAVAIALSVAFGLLLPPVLLLRLEARRQLRIRRSIPDTLDLLLVCVEAGVSLDAALLRVGKEMLPVHPELAGELLVINRKTNAGMRREDALHGLFDRTGVEELRTLASTMIQSEKWGSSIGRVLRVFSESLRRTRRQAAERKAAVAAPKMVFPMVLFILPALLAIIGGPMIMGIKPVLDSLGK